VGSHRRAQLLLEVEPNVFPKTLLAIGLSFRKSSPPLHVGMPGESGGPTAIMQCLFGSST
jgi:hypothetical protein